MSRIVSFRRSESINTDVENCSMILYWFSQLSIFGIWTSKSVRTSFQGCLERSCDGIYLCWRGRMFIYNAWVITCLRECLSSILDIARSQITCISPIAIGDILKCNNRVSVVALWQTFFKILPIFERKRNHARRAGDVRDNFLSPRFSSSHYRYVDYMWYLERIVYLGGGTARNAQNIPLK